MVDMPSPAQGGAPTKLPSALKVTVPSELEGIAYIQVKNNVLSVKMF